MNIKIINFFVSLIMLVTALQLVIAGEVVKDVELDNYIATQRPMVEGKKTILPSTVAVRFKANIKRYPEQRELKYIYTALSIANFSPMPVIRHRMFIESEQKNIIPVYVEERVAEQIGKVLPLDQPINFLAYHVFNYDKGPAMLIYGFEPLGSTE